MKNCLVEGMPEREMKSGRGSGCVREIKASSMVLMLFGCGVERRKEFVSYLLAWGGRWQ